MIYYISSSKRNVGKKTQNMSEHFYVILKIGAQRHTEWETAVAAATVTEKTA